MITPLFSYGKISLIFIYIPICMTSSDGSTEEKQTENKINRLQGENKNLQENLERFIDKIENRKEENLKNGNHLEKLKFFLNEIEIIQNGIGDLKNENENLKNENNKIATLSIEYNETIKTLKSRNNQLQTILNTNQATIKNLESKIQTNQTNTQEMEYLRQFYSDKSNEVTALLQKLDQSTEDNKALKTENKALKTENETLKQDNETLKTKNKTLSDIHNTYLQKLPILQKKLKQANTDKMTMQQSHKMTIHNMKSDKNDEIQKEINKAVTPYLEEKRNFQEAFEILDNQLAICNKNADYTSSSTHFARQPSQPLSESNLEEVLGNYNNERSNDQDDSNNDLHSDSDTEHSSVIVRQDSDSNNFGNKVNSGIDNSNNANNPFFVQRNSDPTIYYGNELNFDSNTNLINTPTPPVSTLTLEISYKDIFRDFHKYPSVEKLKIVSLFIVCVFLVSLLFSSIFLKIRSLFKKKVYSKKNINSKAKSKEIKTLPDYLYTSF